MKEKIVFNGTEESFYCIQYMILQSPTVENCIGVLNKKYPFIKKWMELELIYTVKTNSNIYRFILEIGDFAYTKGNTIGFGGRYRH